MSEEISRSEIILGKEAINKLKNKSVTIFGIGGVGSFAVEALARCFIGKFILVDGDTISKSNINRQLIALNSTIGKHKTDIMYKRILDINPRAKVEKYNTFYLPNQSNDFLFNCDYVVDAIDTITSKLDIAEKAEKKGLPIISAMGAANKLDPTLFEVSDIYDTSVCPICRIMRKELRQRKIKKLKVVYSKEKPIKPIENTYNKRQVLGSVSFVPSVMGLIIAGEVIKDLIKI